MERDMASAFLSVAKPALVRTISPFTQIYIYILLIDVACFTSVHDGEWVSDEFTGRGRLTFLDGTLCQGTWKAGKQHGFGSITWSNGGKFVSVWEAFQTSFVHLVVFQINMKERGLKINGLATVYIIGRTGRCILETLLMEKEPGMERCIFLTVPSMRANSSKACWKEW